MTNHGCAARHRIPLAARSRAERSGLCRGHRLHHRRHHRTGRGRFHAGIQNGDPGRLEQCPALAQSRLRAAERRGVIFNAAVPVKRWRLYPNPRLTWQCRVHRSEGEFRSSRARHRAPRRSKCQGKNCALRRLSNCSRSAKRRSRLLKFHNSVMWRPEMTRRHKHAARAQ